MKQKKPYDKALPNSAELEGELRRVLYQSGFCSTVRGTLSVLIIAAAAAILIATLWLPVLQIYGSSMSPNLEEGNIVLSVKESSFKRGDVVAFYYGNKLLVKRYIAGPGDMVNITEDGTVLVNGKAIDEPYVQAKALGNCDIEFPYQVPDNKYFLLGDHRETSIDSRHSAVGCVAEEQIVGKIVYRIWPLSSVGRIDG